jgi:hypothetical protein
MREMGRSGRWRLGFPIATILLAIAASPATASVTIGQLGDPTTSNCVPVDRVPVIPAATYTAPAQGTITSWTMFASAGSDQQVRFKVFRKIGEPAKYEVVGHSETRTLTPIGTLGNSFPTSIPVRAGDLIGIRSVTSIHCVFVQQGSMFASRVGDLADGGSGDFNTGLVGALDIQATLVPENSFSVVTTQRNKKNGTASVTLNLPNPGDLSGSGNGAKVSSSRASTSKAVPAGPATLLVKAKGKKKRTLNGTGKAKLNIAVTYRPTGGDPTTQSLKVKLRKKH